MYSQISAKFNRNNSWRVFPMFKTAKRVVSTFKIHWNDGNSIWNLIMLPCLQMLRAEILRICIWAASSKPGLQTGEAISNKCTRSPSFCFLLLNSVRGLFSWEVKQDIASIFQEWNMQTQSQKRCVGFRFFLDLERSNDLMRKSFWKAISERFEN